MPVRAILYTIVLTLAAVAGGILWWMQQDDHVLTGRKVDYHKIYDVFWDVACDTAMDGSDQGCYVQYVDVYRPRPEFAAAMVEVVYHKGADGQPDPHIRFDIEPAYTFEGTRIAVSTPSGQIPVDTSVCSGPTCRISGDQGKAVLAAWRKGEALSVTIDEGREALITRQWPLGNINAILDDLAAQRATRGLP